MKAVAILVNVFLPGVGTLFVGKVGEGIAQIILYWIGVVLCFTVVGAVVGIPLCMGIWIWSLVSAGTSKESAPQQIIIQNVVSGHAAHVGSPASSPVDPNYALPSATVPRALPNDRV